MDKFKCKCGVEESYDEIDSFDPHPSEEESRVVKKYYKRKPNGVYAVVGIEIAGAEGGNRCQRCTNNHEKKRREQRENRLEDMRRRIQPKTIEPEEHHGKR